MPWTLAWDIWRLASTGMRQPRTVGTLHLPPLETLLENRVARGEVIEALVANRINPERAGALLLALQQRSLNLQARKQPRNGRDALCGARSCA